LHIAGNILKTMAVLLLIVYGGMIVYAYWPYGEGVPVEQLAGPDDRFIDVDGIQIRYRSWGQSKPDQPTLVFIHGFANSLQSFKRIAPELAADYQVIALDMPGFGLSEKPVDHDYSNASQARVIARFIAELNLPKVVIGGHSMGGAHALHVAEMTPNVVGMILFNPGIITTSVPAVTEYFFFPLPRLSAKIFGGREFRGNFLASSYLDPDFVTDAVMEELMLAPRSEGYIEGTTALMGYYTAGNEVNMLADVQVPTLIIWGLEDKRKPQGEAEQLNEMIAGSRLVTVEDAAHYVHEEQPQIAAQAIIDAKDFWESTEANTGRQQVENTDAVAAEE
jgi:pimeloyl-ACP methyl ester carboxylesterase